MSIFRKFLLLSMLLVVTLSTAEPASWYKWRSKLNAHVTCSQTSPGEGWEQLAQAYLDARCERPRQVR
ncbi:MULTISPECIES: hypothetical protein [Undibacterium]|jgi:hypothetical protein|nr:MULTISPECIES: hypothetical protein [Undibacterium]MDP1980433.1 hypothetical protein [Undibacterium sp.]